MNTIHWLYCYYFLLFWFFFIIFYLLCFRKDTSILELVDIGMLCAMGPPGGGRNSVTQRFVRHFNVISMLSFDEQTMKNIFSPIMDWHFNSFETNHRRWSRVRMISCDCKRSQLQQTTNFMTSFPIFEKYKVWYDASRRFSWNIMPYSLFLKSGKILNCRLLQYIGGTLRVKGAITLRQRLHWILTHIQP